MALAGFAELVADVRRRCPVDELAVDDLVSYATARWGREHHITSLMRLRVELASARPRFEPVGKAVSDDGETLVLSPHAVLFESLHDCGAILGHLANRPAEGLAAELTRDRRDYLAIRSDLGVRLFELDPVSHLVASAFAAPASADAVAGHLSDVLERPISIDAIVDGLVSARALVPPSTVEPEPLVAASR